MQRECSCGHSLLITERKLSFLNKLFPPLFQRVKELAGSADWNYVDSLISSGRTAQVRILHYCYQKEALNPKKNVDVYVPFFWAAHFTHYNPRTQILL